MPIVARKVQEVVEMRCYIEEEEARDIAESYMLIKLGDLLHVACLRFGKELGVAKWQADISMSDTCEFAGTIHIDAQSGKVIKWCPSTEIDLNEHITPPSGLCSQ